MTTEDQPGMLCENEAFAVKIAKPQKNRPALQVVTLREQLSAEAVAAINKQLVHLPANFVAKHSKIEVKNGQTVFATQMQGKILQHVLQNHEQPIPEVALLQIATDLLEGIQSIHSAKFLCRNLVPENVQIVVQHHLKKYIVGFINFSDLLPRSDLGYWPPEYIQSHTYAESSDYWQFGVLLFYLSYRQLPYQAQTPEELLEQQRRKLAFPSSGYCKINTIISQLLNYDANKRIVYKKLLYLLNSNHQKTVYYIFASKNAPPYHRDSVICVRGCYNTQKYFGQKKCAISDSKYTQIDTWNLGCVEELDLSKSAFESLDTQYLANVKVLKIDNSAIASLEFKYMPKLIEFCAKQSKITELKAEDMQQIEQIAVGGTAIRTLEMKYLKNLTGLWIWETKITHLDLQDVKKLKILNIQGCQFEGQLDFSGLEALEELRILESNQNHLDLRSLPNLKKVYTGDNQDIQVNEGVTLSQEENVCAGQ